MRRSVSRVVAVLAVAFAAVAANAGDLNAAKASLGGALTTRIAAIGVPPKKSALAKELKHLRKASTSLGRFAGVLDAEGIIALVSTGRSIVKSLTADPAVASETSVTAGCVIDALTAQEAQLVQDAQQMLAPSDQLKFQGLLDAARTSVAEAEALGATNAGATFAKLREAFATYAKAGKLVQRVIERQDGQVLPILRGGSLRVQNRNGQLLRVEAVAFDLFYFPTVGARERIKANWDDHRAAAGAPALPYKIPPFDSMDPATEFDMYPTLYEAVRAYLAGLALTPDGSVKGVVVFTSSKHGKVLIPVDQALFVP